MDFERWLTLDRQITEMVVCGQPWNDDMDTHAQSESDIVNVLCLIRDKMLEKT